MKSNVKVDVFFDASPVGNTLCCVDVRKSKPWFKSLKGELTSNDLEWYALLSAAEYIAETYEWSTINVYGDSKLVVNQMNGKWKINKEGFMIVWEMVDYWLKVCGALNNTVVVDWVPRDKNLAGIALDRKVSVMKRRTSEVI